MKSTENKSSIESYEAPALASLEVAVERGFAATGDPLPPSDPGGPGGSPKFPW